MIHKLLCDYTNSTSQGQKETSEALEEITLSRYGIMVLKEKV